MLSDNLTMVVILSLATCLRVTTSQDNADDEGFADTMPPSDHEARRNEEVFYSKDAPLIFVAGAPRSGSAWLRKIIDRHPAIRCSSEPDGVVEVLKMLEEKISDFGEQLRLDEAGVTREVFNDALGAYILSLVLYYGDVSDRYCLKYPFELRNLDLLLRVFPKATFLWLIRDPRAVCHSITRDRLDYRDYPNDNMRQCLAEWNKRAAAQFQTCIHYGPARCLPVYFEQLVLNKEATLRQIFTAINVTWDSSVLEVPGGDSPTATEPTSESLYRWTPSINAAIWESTKAIAPLARQLGYVNPRNPLELPDYGGRLPRTGFYGHRLLWHSNRTANFELVTPTSDLTDGDDADARKHEL